MTIESFSPALAISMAVYNLTKPSYEVIRLPAVVLISPLPSMLDMIYLYRRRHVTAAA